MLHINHLHSFPLIHKRIEDMNMFNELANAIDEVHRQVGQDRAATLGATMAKLGLETPTNVETWL